MNPYYASWQASGHSEVHCLECHVDPGFAGLVRAKLNGLAQAVDYSLGRNSTKPNALVGNTSCLREGCHTTESLLAEPVTFIDDRYKFSHRGHIVATVSGLPVLCTTCHSHFEGEEHFKVSTQVCFICHFSKAGAGSDVRLVNTKCWDCHDVPAEPIKKGIAQINHTKFILARLDCEQMCHNRQVGTDVQVREIRCLDCHNFRNQEQYSVKDLHVSHSRKDKVECVACHEMINHSANPIEKHHTSLKCDKCHHVPFEGSRLAEIEFIKMPGDCRLCHDDPHSDQFDKACQQCHNEHGWTGRWVADNHGQGSRFPLLGEHMSIECARCHVGEKLSRARFPGLPHACKNCHGDPHSGQFTKDCTACHSEQGWKNILIDPHGHGSSFPLVGRHAGLECKKCHTPPEQGDILAKARFAGLAGKGCTSCHTDPHRGRMHSACNICHSEHGWIDRFLLFSHERNTRFRLDRIHDDLACSSCHKAAEARIFGPLPETCESCHTDIVRLQSAQQAGTSNPHFGRVSCVQCHSPQREYQSPADYANACRNCHNRHYEGLFYDWARSFSSSRSKAKVLMERLREHDPQKAGALEQKIEQAWKVGFHNLTLALKSWDDILDVGVDNNTQMKHE